MSCLIEPINAMCLSDSDSEYVSACGGRRVRRKLNMDESDDMDTECIEIEDESDDMDTDEVEDESDDTKSSDSSVTYDQKLKLLNASAVLAIGEEQPGEGMYGVVTVKGNFVEKRSKLVDYTLENEYIIGKMINSLESVHFAKVYSFSWDDGYDKSPILRIEKIDGDLFKKYTMSDNATKSVLVRTLTAMAIVNEEFGISHNDLHSNNVMLRDTDVDVQTYIFPDGETFSVKTYGKSPVIIDFGMAFPGKAAKSMTTTMQFTNIGLFPHEMDKLADSRRLFAGTMNDPVLTRYRWDLDFETCGLHLNGWYNTDTFPDVVCEIREETGDIIPSDHRLDIFAASVRLPLRHVKQTYSLADALKNLDKTLTITDIKHLLDNNSFYIFERFGKDQKLIKYLINQCHDVVRAINNIIFKHAQLLTKLKEKYYKDVSIQCTRDCARMIHNDLKVTYKPGMRVSIYYVSTRTTKIVVLDEITADQLSAGASLTQLFGN